MQVAPDKFTSRYKLSTDEAEGLDGYDLFELVARKRGMLMAGGAVNSSRCAEMLLDEFRGAVIGRISLESPKDIK
jgi:ribosome biogenesis GTPase A